MGWGVVILCSADHAQTMVIFFDSSENTVLLAFLSRRNALSFSSKTSPDDFATS